VVATEGTQRVEFLDGAVRQVGELDFGVYVQRRDVGFAGLMLRRVAGERFTKGIDTIRPDAQPGGRLVSAEAFQMLAARRQRGMQVESVARPPGPLPRLPLLIQRDHDGGPLEVLGDAPGDDPDDPHVPFRMGQHQRAVFQPRRRLIHQLARLSEHAPLDGLPVLVQLVDVLGKLAGALRVVGCEQFDSEAGLPKAAGGVETGSEAEADVLCDERRLLVQAGDFEQRSDSGDRQFPQRLQAVADQDPVFADQRDDVGDGSQRGEADGRFEKLTHRRRGAAAFTQPLADGPGQLERDPGTAEVAKRIRSSRQPRMDETRRIRQLSRERVMVGHNQLEAQFPRQCGLSQAGDAAIHGDNQSAGVFGLQLAQGVLVEAVPLLHTAGDVVVDARAGQTEAVPEDAGGGDPVDVIVAIHGDPPAGTDGRDDAIGGVGDSGEQVGIVQVVDVGPEERLRLGAGADAARGQHRGQEGRAGELTADPSDDDPIMRRNAPRARHVC
jgi:hypothetical protein